MSLDGRQETLPGTASGPGARTRTSRAPLRWVWTGLAVAVVLGFTIWLSWPVITHPGIPWGTDTHGHLARVAYMADTLKESGSLPEWFPHWYSGTALVQYYPPLSTYAMVPIQLVTGDITATYRVFVVASVVLAGLMTFLVVRRWASPWWAALAALLYVGAPFTVRTVFNEGNLPRTLDLVLMPLMLYLTLRLIETGSRRIFAVLTATTFAFVLTHHQQAAFALIALGTTCLVYMTASSTVRRNVVLAFAAYGLGIALAIWWLLPAMTHYDYPTVPDFSLLSERLPLYSMNWFIFNPGVRNASIEMQYLGLSLVLLAALVVILRPSRRNLALAAGAGISVFLSFGLNNPLFSFFPAEAGLPERFLNFAVLLLAVLACEWGAILRRYRVGPVLRSAVLVGIVLIVVKDFRVYWHFPRMADYPSVHAALAEVPPQDEYSRLDVRAVDGGSIWSILPIEEADLRLAFGWSIETTPHLPVFSQHNVVIREGFPEFVRRNYALWNVRSAMIGQSELPLIEELERAGFRVLERDEHKAILVSAEPTKPVMEFRANAITVGRGRFPAATALPWFSYATSEVLDEVDERYLDLFDLIFLYDFRFENRAKLQSVIRGWVADGKTVLLDLTAMPDPSLFDVTLKGIEIPPNPDFSVASDAGFTAADIAGAPFGDEAAPWYGVTYDGLDGATVQVRDVDGGTWPVLGYKDIPEGRVHFLGLNWITHILATDDERARFLLSRFAEEAGVYRDFEQPPLPITAASPPADEWSFSYDAQTDVKALVPMTWSGHWGAAVDGEPLVVHNHENLMVLELPAGAHTVRLDYGTTPIQWAGWAATAIAALLALAACFYFERLKQRYLDGEAAVRRWLGELFPPSATAHPPVQAEGKGAGEGPTPAGR